MNLLTEAGHFYSGRELSGPVRWQLFNREHPDAGSYVAGTTPSAQNGNPRELCIIVLQLK